MANPLAPSTPVISENNPGWSAARMVHCSASAGAATAITASGRAASSRLSSRSWTTTSGSENSA